MFRRRGDGQGAGQGRRPRRGLGGGPKAAGPGGNCVCPNCGKKITHKAGVPCYEEKCPDCGTQMIRD
jgi:hypothetical protein